jgi:hypothetical protein
MPDVVDGMLSVCPTAFTIFLVTFRSAVFSTGTWTQLDGGGLAGS